MKNFADIEDMLILARPPQSELISCIGEPELGVRALEPRGLIEETEITETKIDSPRVHRLENWKIKFLNPPMLSVARLIFVTLMSHC